MPFSATPSSPSSLTFWREALLNKSVNLFALLIHSQIYSHTISHFNAQQPSLKHTAGLVSKLFVTYSSRPTSKRVDCC